MNLSLAWAKKCVVLKRCEVRMTPAKQLGVLRLAYGRVGNRAAPSHLAFGLDYGSTIKKSWDPLSFPGPVKNRRPGCVA